MIVTQGLLSVGEGQSFFCLWGVPGKGMSRNCSVLPFINIFLFFLEDL